MPKITNSELADRILENPQIAIKVNRKDLMKKLNLSRKPKAEGRDCDVEELVQMCVGGLLEEIESSGEDACWLKKVTPGVCQPTLDYTQTFAYYNSNITHHA